MSYGGFGLRCALVLGWVVASTHAQDAAPPVQLAWQPGPTTGAVGAHARIEVPPGYVYLGKQDTIRLLELMQNPTSGAELATLSPAATNEDWFLFFTFEDVGYVKDDERDELDADALLESIREGTEAANEVRRDNGWSELHITGWERAPTYNASTNNLEWAIRAESEGGPTLNHNIRLLGRRGVMSAELVTSPEHYASAVAAVGTLLSGFSFTEGNGYAEYAPGDKVAEYGLAALVTGGAAAVALKTGLFKKFWKLIVVAVLGLGALLKRVLGRRGKAA
jgi:uncharacterized membrane-anchored protein